MSGITVPWQCWDQPGFKTKHDEAFATAQKNCNILFRGFPKSEEACVDDQMQASLVKIVEECQKELPKGSTPTGNKIPAPPSPGGGLVPTKSFSSYMSDPLFVTGAAIAILVAIKLMRAR